MNILLIVAAGLLLVILSALFVNRAVGGLAAAACIVGITVYLTVDPALGVMIFKGALFVIGLLIAARVFKAIF